MRYKASPGVSGNEVHYFHDESCSPVADCSIGKMVMFMCLQQGWEIDYLEFDNAFPNRRLYLTVYVELPKYVYSVTSEAGHS